MALLFIALFSTGCSTPQARLSQVPQTSAEKAIGHLYIGPFIDNRHYEKNFTTAHLGTVRGGFGNVLMRVADWRGADAFVREQTVYAARHASFIADSTPDTIAVQEDGTLKITSHDAALAMRPIVTGTINKLAVESASNRIAEADIDITLLDPVAAKAVWSHKLLDSETAGVGSGIAEDTTMLKSWLARLIQEQTLLYLATPEFQAKVSETASVIATHKDTFTITEPKFDSAGAPLPAPLPDGDFFHFKDTAYVALPAVTTTTEVSHRRLWVPFAGLPGERFFFIPGQHAPLELGEQRPVFFTRRKPATIKLVQLGYRKSEDRRFVVFVSYRSDRERPFTANEVAQGIYRLEPNYALAAGEYAFLVGDKEMLAFDFTIR